MNETMRTRSAAMDLLKLLCMAMVVLMHSFTHSGIWSHLPEGIPNYYGAHALIAFSRVAVDTFVLIAGYYGLNNRFSSRKVALLIGQTICFSVLLMCAGLALGVVSPTFDVVFRSFLPLSSKMYWFMSAYVAMYLISPFLARLVHALDVREHFLLVVTLGGLFCGVQFVYPNADVFQLENGYSLIWFLYLWLIGSYLARVPRKKRAGQYLGTYLVLCLISYGLTILFNHFKGGHPALGTYEVTFRNYNSAVVLLASVNLLQGFASLPQGGNVMERLLSRAGRYTLSIYLIHEYPYLRAFLWGNGGGGGTHLPSLGFCQLHDALPLSALLRRGDPCRRSGHGDSRLADPGSPVPDGGLQCALCPNRREFFGRRQVADPAADRQGVCDGPGWMEERSGRWGCVPS